VPRTLEAEEVLRMDVVVSTCGEEACPVTPPGVRRVAWDLPDPKHLLLHEVRPIRDEIHARVRALIDELDAGR
jgi:protein-tyrosine-phosphatase